MTYVFRVHGVELAGTEREVDNGGNCRNNIYHHYCRKVSGLSNGAAMFAENVTVQPNINSPTSKSANFDVILFVVPQAQS